jgi:hypothetical protein
VDHRHYTEVSVMLCGFVEEEAQEEGIDSV